MRTILLALGLVWLSVGAAQASPLPDLASFRDRLTRAEELGTQAKRVGSVTARIQNLLTERITTRQLRCDEETASLIARERHLGHAYRDLLQAWRVEVMRLQEERQSPTVFPLVLDQDQERLQELVASLNQQLSFWGSLTTWQQTRIEPWVAVCPAALRPAEGLGPWRTWDGAPEPVVVIGVGVGRICPNDVLADGAVVLVEEGKACWAERQCDCTPVPVGDAAVLGGAP